MYFNVLIIKKLELYILSLFHILNKVGVFYPGLRNDFDKENNIRIDINKFLNIPRNSKYLNQEKIFQIFERIF